MTDQASQSTPDDDPMPQPPEDSSFGPIRSSDRKEYRKDLAAWRKRQAEREQK